MRRHPPPTLGQFALCLGAWMLVAYAIGWLTAP